MTNEEIKEFLVFVENIVTSVKALDETKNNERDVTLYKTVLVSAIKFIREDLIKIEEKYLIK